MTNLQGYRSHGEPFEETTTFPRSGDPPAVAAAAVGPGANGDEAVHGGVAANSLPDGELSGWDLLVVPDGSCTAPNDLQELVEALAAGPEFRSAALLRAMERFRDALDHLPGHTKLETMVKVPAGDLLVLTRALLQRLR